MRTIMAAVDFSDATPAVVDAAANLARAFGGRLILLHVSRVPPRSPHYATQMANLVLAQNMIDAGADRQLERIRCDLERRGICVQAVRLIGDRKAKIAEEAGRLDADYIVMGSHGHTALHDVVLGSTTGAVIRRANRCVMVVPARPKRMARPRRTRAIHRRMKMTRATR
jgi:nucleotide-binding universal stress UspA family protein